VSATIKQNPAVHGGSINTYQAFYNGKTIQVDSETSWKAQQKAAELFKVKPAKNYQVTVLIIGKDGKELPPQVCTL
jgi:hypothetical protein